jgi:hypothetical protein
MDTWNVFVSCGLRRCLLFLNFHIMPAACSCCHRANIATHTAVSSPFLTAIYSVLWASCQQPLLVDRRHSCDIYRNTQRRSKCPFVCVCVCMYVCVLMYVCYIMYVRMYLCMCPSMYVNVCMYVCMCMYIRMYMYVCMYVYLCSYVCMHACVYVLICV